MATRSEKERRSGQVEDKCQAVLKQLLLDDDNKYCVDCDNKGPRWASWNLGIFLCIRCAGIHRNLGVHISRVKSVTLDTWTPEQVACLQQMGNSRARAVYEANLPDNFRRPQTDTSLDAFVRAKYEQKKYIAKEWVPPPMPKPMIEVDEPKKKSDRKSRTKATIDASVPNAIPAPKAKSHTPTSSASSTPPPGTNEKQEPAVSKAAPKTSAAVDLLGLDDQLTPSQSQNSDPFGSFLSAAAPQEDNKSAVDAVLADTVATEEESMFKLPPAEDKKQQQMTKESILSLYGQSAPSPSQPQMFGIPGGMYMAPSQQQPFTSPQMQANYTIPVQRGMIPNGLMGAQSGPPPAAHPSQPPLVLGSANMAGTNPFLNPAVAGMYATNQGQATSMGATQLPQQMASMSLGNVPMAGLGMNSTATPAWSAQPSGQTLATNLWQ